MLRRVGLNDHISARSSWECWVRLGDLLRCLEENVRNNNLKGKSLSLPFESGEPTGLHPDPLFDSPVSGFVS
jgi:hypothetical protein